MKSHIRRVKDGDNDGDDDEHKHTKKRRKIDDLRGVGEQGCSPHKIASSKSGAIGIKKFIFQKLSDSNEKFIIDHDKRVHNDESVNDLVVQKGVTIIKRD